jgi:hypothetical protein
MYAPNRDLRWTWRAIGLATLCPPATGSYPASTVLVGVNGTELASGIRPTVASSCRARLWMIKNDESPRTVQGPRALERGKASFRRHLTGGDRGMKTTRARGTARTSAPFLFCDHAIGLAFGYAPTPLSHSRGSAMT